VNEVRTLSGTLSHGDVRDLVSSMIAAGFVPWGRE
jgi:hypothetical protein